MPQEKIIPGDLFFFLKKEPNLAFLNAKSESDEFIDAVCLSATTVNHQVFHVGLFIDETTIIHATTNYGVIKQPFTDAMISTKPSIVEVYRIRCTDEQRKKAIEFAFTALGSKYNDIFSPNFINSNGEKSFYCCQFICAAYGRDMFNPHTLNFLDENGEMLEYWIKYYKERNHPIPQGLPGSHPSIIKSSKCLTLIKTFKVSKNLEISEEEIKDEQNNVVMDQNLKSQL